MNSTTRNPDALAALPAVVIHGTLWAAFLHILLRGVPPFKRIFADFGMKLPWVTEVVLDLADWGAEYWPLLLIALAVLLAVDGIVSYLLYANPSGRWRYWLWFTVLGFVPVFAGYVVMVAMFEPLLELMNGLAK